MLVVPDPVLITFVQSGDVVDTYALFILASPLLDLSDEVRDGTSELD